MSNIIDLNPFLRREAQADANVKVMQHHLDNPATVDVRAEIDAADKRAEDLRNLFFWLAMRTSGQDLKVQAPMPWHGEEQRGAVPLHPTGFYLDRVTSEFVDPNGTGRYRLVLEKIHE